MWWSTNVPPYASSMTELLRVIKREYTMLASRIRYSDGITVTRNYLYDTVTIAAPNRWHKYSVPPAYEYDHLLGVFVAMRVR